MSKRSPIHSLAQGQFKHARKRFGQHALKDTQVLENIAAAINPRKTDHIVEIGPGGGALTEYLADHCAQLDTIEIDRDLIEGLEKRFTNNFHVFNEDVLQFDFQQLIKNNQKLKIIGNLPYNISTPLFFHLFQYADIIDECVFMIQKEVALRLTAEPKTKAYGRLTIMSQIFCFTEVLFEVPPSAFSPPPKVDSAVIRMLPHLKPKVIDNYTTLENVVREAFNHRRKTLRQALKHLISAEKLSTLDIDPRLRPEALSLNDYITIANVVNPQEANPGNQAQLKQSKVNKP